MSVCVCVCVCAMCLLLFYMGLDAWNKSIDWLIDWLVDAAQCAAARVVDVDDKHSNVAFFLLAQRRLLLLLPLLPFLQSFSDQLSLTLLVLQLSTHVADRHRTLLQCLLAAAGHKQPSYEQLNIISGSSEISNINKWACNNKLHREIRRAKNNFERKLAENIKRDSKSFYAYVRSKAKGKINIGPLVNKDGEVISLAEDMSKKFNKFFISVFTNEGNESIPQAEWMYKGPTDEQLCDLEITEERVLSELERLRDDKAAGADDLVPRFLSKIKGNIS